MINEYFYHRSYCVSAHYNSPIFYSDRRNSLGIHKGNSTYTDSYFDFYTDFLFEKALLLL